jgi:hypothetical protein
MKALSLWNPWAALVRLGQKRVETRSWPTSYRGPLAIHATRTWTKALYDVCRGEPFATALRSGGVKVPVWSGGCLPRPVAMSFGAIVAVARLTDCIPTGQVARRQTDSEQNLSGWLGVHVGPTEYAFGDFSPGRFAWLLEDIRPLPRPVPCAGARQLWDVPAAALAEIEGQLNP